MTKKKDEILKVNELENGELEFETPPSKGKRVTFDQVDNAFAEVPYLVPKLKYWGQVWVLDVEDPDPNAEHSVIFESISERDYREVIEFGIKWVQSEEIAKRLEKLKTPEIVIEVTVKNALVALNRELQNGK